MTEHELALQQKEEYTAFAQALADLKVPAGLGRWHAEVCEMFDNQHEETLYYGED